jgi:hypothetical protein
VPTAVGALGRVADQEAVVAGFEHGLHLGGHPPLHVALA